jgi:hypothetical protein
MFHFLPGLVLLVFSSNNDAREFLFSIRLSSNSLETISKKEGKYQKKYSTWMKRRILETIIL